MSDRYSLSEFKKDYIKVARRWSPGRSVGFRRMRNDWVGESENACRLACDKVTRIIHVFGVEEEMDLSLIQDSQRIERIASNAECEPEDVADFIEAYAYMKARRHHMKAEATQIWTANAVVHLIFLIVLPLILVFLLRIWFW